MPFLTEHLWRNLVQDGPASVHLAPWPEADEPDRALLAEIADGAARRRARPAGAVGVAAEAPPAAAAARRRRGGRRCARARRRDRRGAARQGGRVRRGRGVGAAREAEPAGARPEARRGAARRARAARSVASSRSSTAAASRSTATCSSPTRCSSSASGREGWAVASEDGVTVALDTALDDDLAPRGPPLRPHPRGERAAQGERSRDHRPDPALDPGRGPARALRATGSPPRRSRSRSSPATCGSRRPRCGWPSSRWSPLVAGGLRRRAARRRRRRIRRPRRSASCDQIAREQVRARRGATSIPTDQDVAPRGEYVDCETRSPVIARPRGVKVAKVTDESFGIGDGTFVESEGGRGAADVRRRVQGHAHRSPRRGGRARGSGSCRRAASATTRRTAARPTRARAPPPVDQRRRPASCCASASASSRRSSTGRRNSTSSSTSRYGSMSVDAARAEPVADALDELLRRGRAGGDADDLDAVDPRLVDLASRRRSGATATPFARATSTSRFEFDELREPITSSRSISPSISLTAHWRFEVA